MYTFRKMIVDKSKYSIKCPYPMVAEYITIHNTANDASALNEVMYHNRNNNQISYHYAVDDKEVIQCIETNLNAWHCGDNLGKGNMKSIGIEICYSKSGGDKYTKAEQNAVLFTAQLLHERGWGVDRIRQHYDWSKKNCPHRIRDEKRWDSFVKRIQVELDKLKQPIKPSIPTTQGGSRKLKLENYQRNEMVSIYKKLQDKKVFTTDWSSKLKKDDVTVDDAIYLLHTMIDRLVLK